MQEALEKRKTGLPMQFCGALFLLSMLISLDGLATAEKAVWHHLLPKVSDPNFTKLFIFEPWTFSLFAGSYLWSLEKRGVIQREVAGTLLIILGMFVGSAYQLLGKFAVGH